MGWKELIAILVRFAALAVERVRKKRAADLRDRLATDPCGVLLDKLNPSKPGTDDASDAIVTAKAGPERDRGRVDG